MEVKSKINFNRERITKSEILSEKYQKEYSPIIKPRGFNPSPVAGKIPSYANSVTNPDCIDTPAYNEFWEEQLYYCLHGYYTKGFFIPPKMYHYLNFTTITGVKTGEDYPYFVDLHYELFMLEYEIRNETSILGATIPKARRKGLSFFGTQLANYGSRFIDGYRMGVASGLGTYVEGFRKKFVKRSNNTVNEMKMNIKNNSSEQFVFGYTIIEDVGEIDIINGDIWFKTMEDDGTKFEGEYFHDVIGEEMGEFERGEEMIVSVMPALMDGDDIVGKIWSYGTGGNMSKGGKVFQSIYSGGRYYQFVNFFIKGSRYYMPSVRVPNRINDTPYLNKQYEELDYEQLLGCEDTKRAQELIDAKSKELSKNPDKTKFIQFRQNFPDTVEDVFMSSGSNNFNTELLFEQNYKIDSVDRKWSEYILEFEREEDGNLIIPLKVYARLATKKDPEWKIIKIYQHPNNKYSYLDCMGVDGYNEDQSKTSKSLGGICVLRDYTRLQSDMNVDEPGIVPIAIYYKRPPRKEQFYDIALKTAVYYGLEKRAMISAESDLVIAHFKNNYGRKYLAKRPKRFDSPNSKKVHDYGVKMDSSTKNKLLGIMQTWVEDNYMYNWFKELNLDLAGYNEEYVGDGDWDLADALGIALTYIMNKSSKKNNEEKEEIENRLDFDEWERTNTGILRKKEKSIKNKKESEKNWEKLPNAFGDNL